MCCTSRVPDNETEHLLTAIITMLVCSMSVMYFVACGTWTLPEALQPESISAQPGTDSSVKNNSASNSVSNQTIAVQLLTFDSSATWSLNAYNINPIEWCNIAWNWRTKQCRWFSLLWNCPGSYINDHEVSSSLSTWDLDSINIACTITQNCLLWSHDLDMQSKCIALIHGISDTCICSTDHCTCCTQSMICVSTETPLWKAQTPLWKTLLCQEQTTHCSWWMFCVAKWWWESHLFDLSMCELYWLLLLPPSMLETLFAAWRTGSAALFSLSGWTTPLPCMDSTIMLKLQKYLAEPSKLPCQALKTHCADMSVILGTKYVAAVHEFVVQWLCCLIWKLLMQSKFFLGLSCTPCSWRIDMCQNLCIWCMLSDLSPFYLQPANIMSVEDLKHMWCKKPWRCN